MQEENRGGLRELESVQLPQTITSLAVSVDYLAAGCLDDSYHLWSNDFSQNKLKDKTEKMGNAMGVVDLAFNKKSTHLAVSCMDSVIKVIDLLNHQTTSITCNVMQNWKVTFLDEQIVTGGDMGLLKYYDLNSKEPTRKLHTSDVFLTAVAVADKAHFLAAGNNNGRLFIVNESKKQKTLQLTTHHKLLRDIAFIDEDTKIATASDDCSIKLTDISSQKLITTLEGHKEAVSSVCAHQDSPSVLLSCSFDKTIRSWDLRKKDCISTTATGSPLWAIRSAGRHVLTGGQNGILNVYAWE